jgi:large subunit ribosomal protein L28
MSGHNISHSHRKTKRRWLPNLQKIRILEKGLTKTARVCTSCIRSNKIEKSL